jgi:hypothetical protein
VSETHHFLNEGFGWECKRCRERGGDAATRVDEESQATALPRFFREGEAEAGATRLSTPSLARWSDESHTTLRCPACGVEEEFKG